MRKKKGFFSISAVAEMFSVHQQTIRLYEKEGFINPKRSQGNTRLFSEEDIERLEEVIYLTHTLGINLAGVELILKLQKKINKLQKQMNELFTQMNQELEQETDTRKYAAKTSAQRLASFATKKTSANDENAVDITSEQ
jgi:MerR family transcriptional regulator/heat shock protein HspR